MIFLFGAVDADLLWSQVFSSVKLIQQMDAKLPPSVPSPPWEPILPQESLFDAPLYVFGIFRFLLGSQRNNINNAIER